MTFTEFVIVRCHNCRKDPNGNVLIPNEGSYITCIDHSAVKVNEKRPEFYDYDYE